MVLTRGLSVRVQRGYWGVRAVRRAQGTVLYAVICCGASGYPEIEVVTLYRTNLCSPAL